MLDGTDLCPQGFHPALPYKSPSFKRAAKMLRRNQVPRVKYYFIDWGLSCRFMEQDTVKLTRGHSALDPDIPELTYLKP